MAELKKGSCGATRDDIHDVLGPVDDEMVFLIQEAGASKDEVMQAFAWLSDDDYMGGTLGRSIGSRIRDVYDILLESQGDRYER